MSARRTAAGRRAAGRSLTGEGNLFEALQFEFMRNALIAGLLTSIACGIIGSLVVVNRIVFISGGVAHASFGGIGLAFFLGISPLLGASVFALAVAMIIGAITLKNRERSDTIIGALWAVGMAIGIILIDMTPGYNADLMSYLFGSIIAVSRPDIVLMIILDAVIVLTVTYYFKDFLALSFDGEYAALRGTPVKLLHFLLLGLVALTVVMTIRVVGLILVIALLTIPTYIAEKIAGSLLKMMVIAVLLAAVFTFTGLWLSFILNITSGASIIMVGAAAFFLFHIYRLLKTA
ncbi:metal ABC transporter permease [candidate division KSB1 bacterium]